MPDLEGRLDRLLAAAMPDQPAARRLFRAMRRDRDDLFRLITRRDVPRTNSACEPALRPSVIFRKVTGEFRAEWGAVVYATAATVIATDRLHRITALAAIHAALAGQAVIPTGRLQGRVRSYPNPDVSKPLTRSGPRKEASALWARHNTKETVRSRQSQSEKILSTGDIL